MDDPPKLRSKLHHTPTVLSRVSRLWVHLPRRQQYALGREEYLVYCGALFRKLLGRTESAVRETELRTIVIEDWRADSGGKGWMGYADFEHAMLNLVDAWVDPPTLPGYLKFLRSCDIHRPSRTHSPYNPIKSHPGPRLPSSRRRDRIVTHPPSSITGCHKHQDLQAAVRAFVAAVVAAVGIALAEAVLGPTVANTFPVSASLIQRRNVSVVSAPTEVTLLATALPLPVAGAAPIEGSFAADIASQPLLFSDVFSIPDLRARRRSVQWRIDEEAPPQSPIAPPPRPRIPPEAVTASPCKANRPREALSKAKRPARPIRPISPPLPPRDAAASHEVIDQPAGANVTEASRETISYDVEDKPTGVISEPLPASMQMHVEQESPPAATIEDWEWTPSHWEPPMWVSEPERRHPGSMGPATLSRAARNRPDRQPARERIRPCTAPRRPSRPPPPDVPLNPPAPAPGEHSLAAVAHLLSHGHWPPHYDALRQPLTSPLSSDPHPSVIPSPWAFPHRRRFWAKRRVPVPSPPPISDSPIPTECSVTPLVSALH